MRMHSPATSRYWRYWLQTDNPQREEAPMERTENQLSP